jgi:hypothetical protein
MRRARSRRRPTDGANVSALHRLRAFGASAALIPALALSLGACSYPIAEFTAISTRNLSVQSEVPSRPVTGTDCVNLALGILPTSAKGMAPSLDAAIENALEQAPGANALQNAELYSEVWSNLLMTRHCFRVMGEAIHVAEAERPPPPRTPQSQ